MKIMRPVRQQNFDEVNITLTESVIRMSELSGVKIGEILKVLERTCTVKDEVGNPRLYDDPRVG